MPTGEVHSEKSLCSPQAKKYLPLKKLWFLSRGKNEQVTSNYAWSCTVEYTYESSIPPVNSTQEQSVGKLLMSTTTYKKGDAWYLGHDPTLSKFPVSLFHLTSCFISLALLLLLYHLLLSCSFVWEEINTTLVPRAYQVLKPTWSFRS